MNNKEVSYFSTWWKAPPERESDVPMLTHALEEVNGIAPTRSQASHNIFEQLRSEA